MAPHACLIAAFYFFFKTTRMHVPEELTCLESVLENFRMRSLFTSTEVSMSVYGIHMTGRWPDAL